MFADYKALLFYAQFVRRSVGKQSENN